MILNRKRLKIGISEILVLLISVLYLIGIRVWFPVCMPMEHIMTCHWAGEVLKALSCLFLALSLIHIFIPDLKMKAGMDIAMISVACITFFIPGHIIPLCGDAMMMCRKGTSIYSSVFALVLAVLLIADIVIVMSYIAKDKHKRR